MGSSFSSLPSRLPGRPPDHSLCEDRGGRARTRRGKTQALTPPPHASSPGVIAGAIIGVLLLLILVGLLVFFLKRR